MFGKRLALFELFGFKVQVDISWVLLAVLVCWSLAIGYFPAQYPGLGEIAYWWMGVVGLFGLAFSILFHELSHSLVARHFNIPIKGITLFIFGGVAEMDEEPPSPRAEFYMAIAGPIASFVLAAAFYAIGDAAQAQGLPLTVVGVAEYLALINLILAVFNLVPAFPLDGGRALRALLWHWRNDYRAATRQAAQMGSVFGLVLIGVGILNFVAGNIVGGVWWALIGLFMRGAAGASVYQLATRRALEGETVERFMSAPAVAVQPGLSLDRFVEDFVYVHHHDFFPVVEGSRPIGGLTTRQVAAVPRQDWPRVRAEEVMVPVTRDNTIEPSADAIRALSLMQSTGNSRLMVVRNGDLVGIISLKDLLKFFAIKVDLEGMG